MAAGAAKSAMNCDPQALIAASREFCCIPNGMQRAVIISLLCEWANVEPVECNISWTPSTFVATWFEGPTIHHGDLPTFLATANVNAVTQININDVSITDIQCLASLPNLQNLNINDSQISTIDLSGCPNLVLVNATSSALLSLDISNHLFLFKVQTDSSLLISINLSGCPALYSLQTQSCDLTSINLSGCPSLQILWAYDNQLGTIDLTGDFALTTLLINNNPAVTIIGP